jgi:PiT family inorganic phosphate transporter
MGALLAALCWNTMTFWLKIPSSNSQALIGGLVGAIWAGFGSQAILMPGLIATLVALIISPLLGMAAGFWLVRLCYLLTSAATPHINQWFNRGQIFLGFVLAVAFGANEGQKLMGVVTLGLMATGFLKTFTIPLWVIVFSASTMGIGALLGGWRLIHTLGDKFYKIRPIHGFGAQLASGTVVFAAALLGGPVSGSQVVTSAIVGAGSADRIKKVRWSIVRDIVAAWVLTLPLSMLIGAVCYWLIERV